MSYRPETGTSLQGYIDISYAEIVQVLGEPTQGDGIKQDAQWVVSVNGIVFTIYNYKDGRNYLGSKGKPVTKIRDWHIGGRNQEAPRLVSKLFPSHRVVSA